MGGIIGLTIRVAPGQEYRGSCHTNVLPFGLWTADFFDPATSARHAWDWIQMILENRRQNPGVEELWGGHDMCAPIQYGLVLIDYVTSTMISAQGYDSPHWMIRWPGSEEHCEKWDALEAAGRLGDLVPGWNDVSPQAAAESWPERRPARYIKLPFEHVLTEDSDKITPELMQHVDQLIGLSDSEKAVWAKFIQDQNE